MVSLGLGMLGCASSIVPPDEETGGTRLRPVGVETEDGTRISTGWYDTELERHCSFVETPDGERRCVPTAVYAGWLHLLYRDADCEQPGWYVRDEEPFVVTRTLSSCPNDRDDRVAVFSSGALERVEVAYERSLSGCRPAAMPSEARRLTPVDPSRFVAARSEPRATTSRLRVDRWVADDGSVLPNTLHDLERDEACRFAVPPLPGARVPCVPVAHDAIRPEGCTDPVGYSTCPPSTSNLALVRPFPTCRRATYEAHAVLGVASSRSVAPECNVGVDGLALGPADDELVAWAEAELAGSGRIRQLRLRHEDVVVPTTALWDTELGDHCGAQTRDGVTRCVPFLSSGYPNLAPTFADSACTQRALLLPLGCDEQTWMIDDLPYRRGEPLTRWYQTNGATGACEPVEASGEAVRLEPLSLDALAVLRRLE